MSNVFLTAKLVSLNTIKVMVFTDIPRREYVNFFLQEEKTFTKLNIIKTTSMNSVNFFDLLLPSKIEFGKNYIISIPDYGHTNLDVSEAVNFKEFDEMFNYDGEDLGAIYHQDHTDFALWAPLASKVFLRIKEGNTFVCYPLIRTEKGVYRLRLKGDYLNKEYDYLVTNNGITQATLDPYGKAVTLNSTHSVVVDLSILENRKKIKPKTKINNYIDAVIYETNVRDFTISKSTNIVNKGKYLGIVEESRLTNNNHPAGLDYLKYLGITHLQLQPVVDFRGVDDVKIEKSYNWGYDPISIFALEGSYSTSPNIPMARNMEFAKMIDELHRHDIRVNIDVVVNHVYEYITSTFEKVVPNYFFRKKKNGQVADASGCGNDFASEKFMARKIIVDALIYFLKTYDVDGFRFDLMGLIDKTTIDEAYVKAKLIKEDVMFYGEGWNMGMELNMDERITIDNSANNPHYAFFNDMFRDIVRGPNYDVSKKGYVNGDITYVDGAEFVIAGSLFNYTYRPRFINVNQSINYSECHDDYTLMDKLLFSNKEEDMPTLLKRVKIANTLSILSLGIPFIHMGQEFGQSKKKNRNTYNMVDINDMDYELLDERFSMVEYLKKVIEIRKNNSVFHLVDNEALDNAVSFYKGPYGVFIYHLKNKEEKDTYKDLFIVINPTKEELSFDIEDRKYRMLLSTDSRYKYLEKIENNIVVPSVSLNIIVE